MWGVGVGGSRPRRHLNDLTLVFQPASRVFRQVLVVACTGFTGVLAMNYQREYTVWVLPLFIVCVFAFLVAHCFLSVFENVVDVLFLCFAVDTKYNDGSPGREYYMDKALMVRGCSRTLFGVYGVYVSNFVLVFSGICGEQ